jgi:hypothetical protein
VAEEPPEVCGGGTVWRGAVFARQLIVQARDAPEGVIRVKDVPAALGEVQQDDALCRWDAKQGRQGRMREGE